MRKRRNRVDTLMNEEGVWVVDGVELKNMALEFYKNLFISDRLVGGKFITGDFPRVEATKRHGLVQRAKWSLWRRPSGH